MVQNIPTREYAERAKRVLLDPSLDPIVDLVAWKADDTYHAATSQGSVAFTASDAVAEQFTEVAAEGTHPLADQSPDKFSSRAVEEANKYPTRAQNSFPYAYAHLAQ